MPRPVRTGRWRGRSARWCSPRSPVTLASRNGQAYRRPKVTPAMSTAGKNGLGTSNPKARISQLGKMRSAPSSQPMYQSGWLAELTLAGTNGP